MELLQMCIHIKYLYLRYHLVPFCNISNTMVCLSKFDHHQELTICMNSYHYAFLVQYVYTMGT